MNTPLRLLALSAALLATSLVASAKITRTVERSFDVSNPGVLHVSTEGGNIKVTVSADNKATIVAHEVIRADSDEEADKILKDMTLTIEQQGNDIIAQSEYHREAGFSWGQHGVYVSFDISVPAKFAAEARTSGGNIVLTDRQAPVTLKTSGGDIQIGNVTGDIDARTSGGNLALVACTGNVELKTSGGNIKAGPVKGTENVDTSGGDIDLVGSGQSLEASTSGGDVVVQFQGPLTQDCTLKTSGGEVKAIIDPSSKFHLDAHTSGGSVRANGLTIKIGEGGVGKSKLEGDVNGGGSELKLRTSGGNIDVVPRAA